MRRKMHVKSIEDADDGSLGEIGVSQQGLFGNGALGKVKGRVEVKGCNIVALLSELRAVGSTTAVIEQIPHGITGKVFP